MSFSERELVQLHQAALGAAEKAARYIRSQSSRQIEVLHKEGGHTEASQVLTKVDLASERIILESLQPSVDAFSLGVLTEETEDDSSRFQSEAFWCIDPIDGTLPFIKREPGYSVVIALVDRSGVPLLGVVWDVAADLSYHAMRGIGSFRGTNALTLGDPSASDPLHWFHDRSMLKHPRYEEWKEALEAAALATGLRGLEITNHAGAALHACWAALSAPAVYFKCPKKENGGGSVWDFAASSCFCKALELPVSDMFGSPLELNPRGSTFMNRSGVLYATDSGWANTVREIYDRLG